MIDSLIDIGMPILASAIRVLMKGLTSAGLGKDAAELEIIQFITQVLTADNNLDELQEARRQRLKARLGPATTPVPDPE